MQGHKEDPRPIEGGRHTQQSIVGYLTPASFNPPRTHLQCAFLSNENTGVRQQHQAGTNANMASAKHRAATPVSVHLRLKGGHGTKSHSELYEGCPYHDVVALHLCLFIGQFVVLHFQTSRREK